MKLTPHDPLDDLIAAALHGELTPEERTQFDARLSRDPAAQAAYQEAQHMHDLLEKTNRSAQPDPDFEQRIVSGVRRKLAHPPHEETALESLVILWKGLRGFVGGHTIWTYGAVGSVLLVCLFAVVFTMGSQVKSVFATIGAPLAIANPPVEDFSKTYVPAGGPPPPKALREASDTDLKKVIQQQGINYVSSAQKGVNLSGYVDTSYTKPFGGRATPMGGGTASPYLFAPKSTSTSSAAPAQTQLVINSGAVASTEAGMPADSAAPMAPASPQNAPVATMDVSAAPVAKIADADEVARAGQTPSASGYITDLNDITTKQQIFDASEQMKKPSTAPVPATSPAAPPDTRKLIRNAQLDLEVKSYQSAFDQIGALTKAAGGYVDTSNSQRGGNGKLQGTVVVKILPENLDAFLLKLRDLGVVQNQSVSTDDVTKDYYDTQARLVNSQKMEEQLQDLLKRENGKVSDLLAVERELGRVRGQIEEMQGQLKLYDFQVQYATVTMNLAEKDLNQAAAYVLREQDAFSLFATDVEGAYQKARAAADKFNGQVLSANLEHDVNSDNNQVAASLVVMVAPEQIEPFLAEIRGLGRVANFTRQTERVAKDGGDSSQPADETKTEKDKVRVQLSISSDNDTRKQVALTVVAKDVDGALDAAKAAALASAGTEILGSSLNTTPDGASSGQLSVRVPGHGYETLLAAFRALGRQAAMSVQRNDNNGPGASGDDVPVILSLALTDNDTPVQTTNLAITADDVDAQAQQIKKQAADAGVEIKASSFQRQPDGTEEAQLTLRLPLGKYPAFLASIEKAGKVDSLSVQRDDRPDQTATDDAAPAEIQLQLDNPPAIVPDNGGLWPTLRNTFGAGFAALFGSIRVIGVMLAFLAPWVVTLILGAWLGRRIYVWRKGR